MTVNLVPARLTHVGPVATKMRDADRQECEALGRSPKEALRGGLRSSLIAFTAVEGGRPIAMLGVVPTALMGGKATVWMLGTESVYRHGRTFLRVAPLVFQSWLGTFDRLENVVSTDNRKAIRLLTRLGFHIGEEVQTHGGVEFVKFWLERAIQERAKAA